MADRPDQFIEGRIIAGGMIKQLLILCACFLLKFFMQTENTQLRITTD
jgi:hypothetical protein